MIQKCKQTNTQQTHKYKTLNRTNTAMNEFLKKIDEEMIVVFKMFFLLLILLSMMIVHENVS